MTVLAGSSSALLHWLSKPENWVLIAFWVSLVFTVCMISWTIYCRIREIREKRRKEKEESENRIRLLEDRTGAIEDRICKVENDLKILAASLTEFAGAMSKYISIDKDSRSN